MLHHVSVGVADVGRSAQFYDAVLGALGFKRVMEFMPYAVAYGASSPSFWVQLPHNQQSPSVGNGAHVGFSARSKDAIHRFHEAALAGGGKDDGAPGPREMYGPDYYGAFIIDLDGNKIEATLHQEAAALQAAAKPRKKTAKAKVKAKAKKGARRPAKRPARKPAKRKARRR
jgi:catechol 2,3-dioxygenase-like lactoylglutathione lyase family enzyme